MAHSSLPAVAELVTLRHGRTHPTDALNNGTQQRSSSVVCIDDESEASIAAVRLLTSAAASSSAAAAATAVDAAAASACPLVCVRSAAASPSISPSLLALPAVRWAFPIAAAADAQAEQKRLADWTKQTKLNAARVVLHISVAESAPAATEMSADRIQALDKLGSVWMIQQQAAPGAQSDLPDSRSHALLQSLLAHSSLPVLFIAPLQPSTSVAATSAAFRWLDSFEAMQGLSKLHVAFAVSAAVAAAAVPASMCTLNLALLAQHWTALRRREEYRAQKRKAEADAALRPVRPAQPASASASAASASASAAVVPAAPAAPAQFYRAAFTPSTMFYRISMSVQRNAPARRHAAGTMHPRRWRSLDRCLPLLLRLGLLCVMCCVAVRSSFAPSLVVSDLLCHAVLQEGLRSLLGSIGASKCTFQLLHWSSDTQTGIVSTSSEMSVGARAAWMLMGSYQQKSCRIDVLQQSVFLMALASS